MELLPRLVPFLAVSEAAFSAVSDYPSWDRYLAGQSQPDVGKQRPRFQHLWPEVWSTSSHADLELKFDQHNKSAQPWKGAVLGMLARANDSVALAPESVSGWLRKADVLTGQGKPC